MASKMNAFQRKACEVYGGGDYAHLVDDIDWKTSAIGCGDTLFQFILIELSDAEDCSDLATACERMDSAQRDIGVVLRALESQKV